MFEVSKGFSGSSIFFVLLSEDKEVGRFPSVSEALGKVPEEEKVEVMRCTFCGRFSLPCEWEEREPRCPLCSEWSGRSFYKIPRSIVAAGLLQKGAPPRSVEVTFGRETYRVVVYRATAVVGLFEGWRGTPGGSPTTRRFAAEDKEYILRCIHDLAGKLAGSEKGHVLLRVIRAIEGGAAT